MRAGEPQSALHATLVGVMVLRTLIAIVRNILAPNVMGTGTSSWLVGTARILLDITPKCLLVQGVAGRVGRFST